jgi:RimJ/RimL family protein N-acetyltransferase
MYGGDPALIQPKTPQQGRDWLDHLNQQPMGWVIDVDGGLAGEILLHGLSVHDRRARLAVGLFAPDDLGKGLGRRAIRLVLAHAFAAPEAGGLALNRVDLRVLAYNERAIRCYRACGFVEEGRERQSAFVAGRFHDDVIMGLLASEFRPA